MKRYLFFNDKNIYKANLHCHTIFSDGKCFPKEIKELYKSKGYSIVAFTDHCILKPQFHLNDEEFLAINACEMDITQNPPDMPWEKKKTYHLNLYAVNQEMVKTPPLPRIEYENINEINNYIKERASEGFLVCYNHPYWSLQNYVDYTKLEGCFAMEIYNHGCEVEGLYGYNPQSYDEMLRNGNKLFCLSTDDNHNHEPEDSFGWDSFGGFVMISSADLKYENIMKSLIKGDFYSSQGPIIHEISIENNKLYIRCSEVDLIVVYTDGRRCYIKSGNSINEAEFELKGDDNYIRIMCRDKEKKDANSNAFWL